MEFCGSLWTLVLIINLMFSFYLCKEPIPLPIPEYEAVAGEIGHLPCNFTIPSDPSLVSLMLWYRDQERAPIYTVDFRKGTRDNPKHFTIPEYAERSYFDVNIIPPTLRLNSISLADEGYYRCHIEFRRSRTITRVVNLKVITPPQSVVIMDDRGQRLKDVAGPYDEGAYLSLLCEAEGGNPSPSVTWWRDKSLLDDTFSRTSQSFVRNEYVFLELRRSDLMAQLTCEASNTNLTQPLREQIRIDLNLKPIYIRITTPQRPLRVGEEIRLHCETSGSRPPAKLSWWIDKKRVQTGKDSIPNSRNITYSTLSITPKSDDNGKAVVCKAENKDLPHPVLQDIWYLNVLFSPEVSLQLGANIKYSTIKEGNDVYMECIIRANPPVGELTWLFENKPFFSNASAGIIISNQSLVLQRVKKEHRGKYRCIASNSEGEGESLDLFLEIRYTPTCKPSKKNIYGLAREEKVNITCEVDSDPADVTFRWALNNSIENVELHNFKSSGSTSIISYMPKSTTDYGSVLCWGRNSVGDQKEPCFFRIIPAGPPDPVRNCVVVNQSKSWLQIECEAGHGNGLEQSFHLDVYNSEINHLEVNLTSATSPSFSVKDLPAGTPFVLVVYASNEKGKSNSLAIMANTLHSDPQSKDSAFSPIAAILLAALGTLLMIGVVGIAFIQLRRRRPLKYMMLKKASEEIVETTIACPDVVPPNNTVYASPDFEGICEITKDSDSSKMKDNYKNCVVSLKKSWSFKKGLQDMPDVEVTLPDFNNPLVKHPSSPPLIGDVTLEECLSNKKIVIKVEHSPEPDRCQSRKVKISLIMQMNTFVIYKGLVSYDKRLLLGR
nr:hemicentin-1 isoform X2 [Parasteatoda tepidariorum]